MPYTNKCIFCVDKTCFPRPYYNYSKPQKFNPRLATYTGTITVAMRLISRRSKTLFIVM